MGMIERFFGNSESRAPVTVNPGISNASGLSSFFNNLWGGLAATGVVVKEENALGVPAMWAAVNVLSSELAGLPLNVFERNGESRERVQSGIAAVLHEAVNPEMSSFDWRKYIFERVLLRGRSITYIERNGRNEVVNLWPLQAGEVTVSRSSRDGLSKLYTYKPTPDGTAIVYAAKDVIDLTFMVKDDGLQHYDPIVVLANSLGLAISATEWGSRFFQNGGIPPFSIQGNFTTPVGLESAAADFERALRKAAEERKQALVMPIGIEAKPLGADPEKAQLVELQRFLIEEIARIYQIPPTFLQDLTHGTFSNTEQQDLHFVKHSLRRWIEQAEKEFNLKLFGRQNRKRYVEFNVDGLLRGDFAGRMSGYSTAIQNGIMKPNEARRRENLEDDPAGDKLMIQGATVALENQLELELGE